MRKKQEGKKAWAKTTIFTALCYTTFSQTFNTIQMKPSSAFHKKAQKWKVYIYKNKNDCGLWCYSLKLKVFSFLFKTASKHNIRLKT